MNDDQQAGGWLPSGIALLALGVRLAVGPWPLDDAYITFRYARNLASGIGLVYNPGQAVFGTSTPLLTLLLALIAAVTGAEIAWAALIISALADAVTALLIHRLARQSGLPSWSAPLCSLTWALYPLGIRYAVGGMETSLATTLLVGALALCVSGRDSLAMAVAGLAVLTRADALAAAFVVLLAQTIRRRRLPWRSIVVLAVTLLPWAVFATWRYGSPLPQSLQAKSHAVYLASAQENLLQVLYYVAGLVLAGPTGLAAQGIGMDLVQDDHLRPIAVAAILLAVLGFAVWGIGAFDSVRRNRRWVTFFAFPLVFCVTYALIGLRGNLMAEWYLVPLAPFLFLGIFAGLWKLCRLIAKPFSTPVGIALSLAIAVAQVAGLDLWRTPGRGALVPRVVWTEREDLYRQAAEFLRPRLRPEEVVAAPEIGALGYYCDCRILDTVGLVSPEVVKYYPLPPTMYVINYAVPPDLIREEKPAYLVSLDVFIWKSLLEAEWFQRDYEVVWETDTSAFYSDRLLVFHRVLQPGASPGDPRAPL